MFLNEQEADREHDVEPTHRRNLPFFGSMMSSIKRRGSPSNLNVNSVQHAKISPTNSVEYAAQQNSFRKIPDEWVENVLGHFIKLLMYYEMAQTSEKHYYIRYS